MNKLMVVAAGLLAASFAIAQDVEIVKVKGRGVGADKTEALKDAYRDAVERAVGLYVDAEQMMKNEELVKDQILTQSNAYIEKYDVVKEDAKPNGLVEVQILAEVRKTALTKKISDVMPSQTFQLNTAATQNLHAKLVTEEKRTKDGAALLKNALEGVDPIRQLVKASLVSPEPKIVEEGERVVHMVSPSGEIVSQCGSDDFVTLRYAFKFEIDSDRYVTEFLPHIQKTFEQISVPEARVVRMAAGSQSFGRIKVSESDMMSSSNGFLDRVILVGRSAGQEMRIGELITSSKQPPRLTSVVLITDVNTDASCGKALVCDIDKNCEKEIDSWYKGCNRGSEIHYSVVISSKSGSDICVNPVRIRSHSLIPTTFNTFPRKGSATGFMAITPFVGGMAKAYYHWVDCKIPKDELPNVSNITIELAE